MTTNSFTAQQVTEMLNMAIDACKSVDLTSADAGALVPLANAVKAASAYMTTVDIEIQTRAVGNGQMLPGVIVKDTVTHRKWHDQEAAEQLAQEQFGDKAFERSLLSPAKMEKLEGGEMFVEMASYKPAGVKRAVY